MNCFKAKPYVPGNENIHTPDWEQLASTTHFTRPELNDLLKKYELICDTNGTLSKEVYLELTQESYCPLIKFCVDQELDVIQTVSESLVDFTSFAETLSVFSSRAGSSEKKLYLFDLLKGSSQSSGITKAKFQRLFLCMVSGSVNAASAEQVFDKIWERAIIRGETSDRVDYQHFANLISDYDLRSFMTFDLLQLAK